MEGPELVPEQCGLSVTFIPSVPPACGPLSSASLPLGMAPLPPSMESFCQMQITCASSAQTAQKNKSRLGALGTVILGLWDLLSQISAPYSVVLG